VSAVGHLLEIGMPEEEEAARKWTFGICRPSRPVELKPIEKNENRLTLLKLIKRKDGRRFSTWRRRPRG
jgi:hypothetical protein